MWTNPEIIVALAFLCSWACWSMSARTRSCLRALDDAGGAHPGRARRGAPAARGGAGAVRRFRAQAEAGRRPGRRDRRPCPHRGRGRGRARQGGHQGLDPAPPQGRRRADRAWPRRTPCARSRTAPSRSPSPPPATCCASGWARTASRALVDRAIEEVGQQAALRAGASPTGRNVGRPGPARAFSFAGRAGSASDADDQDDRPHTREEGPCSTWN